MHSEGLLKEKIREMLLRQIEINSSKKEDWMITECEWALDIGRAACDMLSSISYPSWSPTVASKDHALIHFMKVFSLGISQMIAQKGGAVPSLVNDIYDAITDSGGKFMRDRRLCDRVGALCCTSFSLDTFALNPFAAVAKSLEMDIAEIYFWHCKYSAMDKIITERVSRGARAGKIRGEVVRAALSVTKSPILLPGISAYQTVYNQILQALES